VGVRYWLEEPRELTDADFRQMGLPERFQDSVWEKVPESDAKDLVQQYVEDLRSMREEGMGIYVFGPNGHGKTALGCLILRKYRAHGQSCLFIRHSKLTRASIKGVVVAGERDLWTYSREVDVLLIDDFAKDHASASGFDASELEDLLRDRYDQQLVTLFTSNLGATKLKSTDAVRESTVSVIQGMVIPALLKGKESQRTVEAKKAFKMLWEGEDE